MGWTWSCEHAHYNPKTNKYCIDRKKLCDELYTNDGEKSKLEVIKSCMVGSTYYAAVKATNKITGHEDVFAGICLTAIDNKEYYNFGYKDMDETCGPYKFDCPKSILDLLTPTENDCANEWRQACYDTIYAKKSPDSLTNLPVGSEIKYKRYDGAEVTLVKHAPAYQFKRTFWMIKGRFEYVSSRHIPNNYQVIKRGE